MLSSTEISFGCCIFFLLYLPCYFICVFADVMQDMSGTTVNWRTLVCAVCVWTTPPVGSTLSAMISTPRNVSANLVSRHQKCWLLLIFLFLIFNKRVYLTFKPIFHKSLKAGIISIWERANVSLFMLSAKQGNLLVSFIFSFVWCGLDWGLNPRPPVLEASTLPLGYRGKEIINLSARDPSFMIIKQKINM